MRGLTREKAKERQIGSPSLKKMSKIIFGSTIPELEPRPKEDAIAIPVPIIITGV